MNRRTFLKATSAALATGLSDRELLSAAPDDAMAQLGRLVLSMNRNWRYSPQHADGATTRNFDDSNFERITIPHTNVKLPWHGFDEKSYQFISVYRRHFKMPPATKGRHVFVDFEGAMTAATVWLNGQRLGEYRGGYTPFSFALTPNIDWDGENVLAVELDSTERPDIPPFGGSIDYLTFGGIYRDVRLRIVPATYIENIFARPKDVLSDHPGLDVSCFLARLQSDSAGLTIEGELREGDHVLATAHTSVPSVPASTEALAHELNFSNLSGVKRWDIAEPNLYSVIVRVRRGSAIVDTDSRRVGFRQAMFTDHGFELNGQLLKLRGLDRHQTFPFVGQAMGARAQRHDAYILRRELKTNIVRTSHYPQSPQFLDACDELGLLVLEEIPGWQHIGDQAWQDLAVDNVRRMIRRDWNHPSIILWGVRINESRDNHDLYTHTNALAHTLDPTRPTGGIRNNYQSEFLEDVFTMNDFGFPLRPPNHPRYLNTEFIGHTYPTKISDPSDRLTEHALRHARIHNQLGSNPQYAGGIGWCAFDYDTHSNFGSGDRVCYHGVSDIFRLPKIAAHFYRSQCDATEEVVLEPAFYWAARGDWSNIPHGSKAVIFSNCEHLKLFSKDRIIDADPDREGFPNLPHPPFQLELNRVPWGDLRMEGYIGQRKVIEKQYSSKGMDQDFVVKPDDATLVADGSDATRVVFRVTDEFGDLRRYSTAAIALTVDGPGELIGDNPLSLMGGCAAIWIRAKQQPGLVRLKAVHPVLGARETELHISAAEDEHV